MLETNLGQGFHVPGYIREYLEEKGYALPLDPMDGHIAAWDAWMSAEGDFYDYSDKDSFGRLYEVHRRSLHPAMRVCKEWGSLLLNEKTVIACEDQACTDWLEKFFAKCDFMDRAQDTVVRAFGLGTAAWTIWVDTYEKEIRIRSYDARMVIPLTWDDAGVTECAFCTRAFYKGKPVDQLQMHVKGILGYRIETVCFDTDGNQIEPEGVMGTYETYNDVPTFAIVKPAIENTRVDMSPYGQSVFADAIDAIQAVDLAFDAIMNEVDMGKMRIFLSDVMFESNRDNGKHTSIPFGKHDCTVFRKVMSTEDTIQEFAPALRTEQQVAAFRIALQMLGDLCGFGLDYFDLDDAGYVKTATEVSSDNSALMRNIRRHENALTGALAAISKAVLAAARRVGEELPDEGEVTVAYDDSIVTDTAAEKAQDIVEVEHGLMQPWEYRAKWYGEDEATARQRLSAGTGARGTNAPMGDAMAGDPAA